MKILITICLIFLSFYQSNAQHWGNILLPVNPNPQKDITPIKYDTVRVLLMFYDERQLNNLDGFMGYSNASLHVVNGYMVTEDLYVPEHEVRDTPGEVGWIPSHWTTKLISYLDPNKKRFSKNIKVKQW